MGEGAIAGLSSCPVLGAEQPHGAHFSFKLWAGKRISQCSHLQTRWLPKRHLWVARGGLLLCLCLAAAPPLPVPMSRQQDEGRVDPSPCTVNDVPCFPRVLSKSHVRQSSLQRC